MSGFECVHVSAVTYRGQKRELESLELKLQAVTPPNVGMQGTGLSGPQEHQTLLLLSHLSNHCFYHIVDDTRQIKKCLVTDQALQDHSQKGRGTGTSIHL